MDTPVPATRRATATPSAMVRATGFSQNTGTPASAAATMSSGGASGAAPPPPPPPPRAQELLGCLNGLDAEPLHDGVDGGRDGVSHDERGHRRQRGQRLRVEGTDPAEPDQADSHGNSNLKRRNDQSEPPTTAWSQSITEPVTTPLRAGNRKTTKSAISSTWPNLPMGTDAAAFARQSSPPPWNRRWVASSPSE